MNYLIIIDKKQKVYKTSTGWTEEKADAPLYGERAGYILLREMQILGKSVTFERYKSKSVFKRELEAERKKKTTDEADEDNFNYEYTAGMSSAIQDY